MTRVLQIIPFPSVRPRDGGQIRAQQTGKALEAAGFTVTRCPIYRVAWHPNSIHQPPVVNLDGAAGVPRYQNIWQLYDLTNGEVLANDAQCFVALREFVERARPDVIMLEHPWLWPAIKKLPPSGRAPIIYNSYNLEAELKCRMLKDAGVADADAVAAEIESLERDLVNAATAVSATTEADAAVYRNWASGPVVVAPNGAERRARAHLRDVLPDALRYWWRYLLFVASAHPPNGAGFAELVIEGLTSMRPDERIVVAGSVCNIIAEHPRIKNAGATATDHLVLFGQVSSSVLDCLLENAAGMLLPITYGGGSNLKTAEALLAGHPIIATAKAFRGCEAFADMPGVIIAETEGAFSAAIRRVLSGEVPSLPMDERLGSLVWNQTLRPIIDLVEEVAVRRPPQSIVHALCSVEIEPELSDKPSSNLQNQGERRRLSNDDLLALVQPWSGQVPRGYVPTFTGAMVAVHFWAHWLSTERIAEVLEGGPRFESTRRPTFGDGESYFEQANIIRSVRDAKDRYIMVELGGGNGPRAVDTALILGKLRPQIRPYLVVVEALPTYTQWCRHHFTANGLNPDDHWILNGIVSAEPVPELFFLQPRGFGNQMADASVIDVLSSLTRDRDSAIDLFGRLSRGGVAIKDGVVIDEPARHPIDLGNSNSWTVEAVKQLAVMPTGTGGIGFVSAFRLADILGPLPQVDFMDVDIQHAEIHVIPSSIEILRQKVRLLSIGTHTREIHATLCELFQRDGWHLINDIQPYGHHVRGDESFDNTDGVLTVQNPSL